jgi:hypothetical protein
MREEERKKQLHKKSLSIIKPGIDNRPPPTFPHLTSRVKKIQQEQGISIQLYFYMIKSADP